MSFILLRLNSQGCGRKSFSARVVNGENASPNSWPWQVSLSILDSTATTFVEDHLSEETWFSLQPTASALSRIFAESQSLWVSVC